MTAQGEDVLAWLETNISIRETAARKAADGGSGDWYSGGRSDTPHVEDWELESAVIYDEDGKVIVSNDVWPSKGHSVHIALNDPESVLRRCAADRKLLELHGSRGHACPAYDYDGDLDEWARFYNHEVCPVVQLLAEGYGWTEAQR